ncbi:MAG: glycosyltransferase [Candidatus Glassbacteria bacterium]
MKKLKILLLYSGSEIRRTFSYQTGWVKYFLRDPHFETSAFNVQAPGLIAGLRFRLSVMLSRTDAVVILHSVFSNSLCLGGRLFETIKRMSQPKAFFIGNEYKLLPEKMKFCEDLGLCLLVTMNPDERAQALYRDRLGCRVTCIPSAGVDSELFRPVKAWEERKLDLGYRAVASPLYLGHDERREIAEFFKRRAEVLSLAADISLDPADRFTAEQWAAFLNDCRGQIGTEAGGDYFELDDRTRLRVNQYLKEHSGAGLKEIRARFFENYPDPVPVRTISGRHAEAAASGTVQILFEGRYNDYFQPDVHYIPLRKDFSNADDALRKFRDREFCRQLAQNAQDTVLRELTYEKLIERFYGELLKAGL